MLMKHYIYNLLLTLKVSTNNHSNSIDYIWNSGLPYDYDVGFDTFNVDTFSFQEFLTFLIEFKALIAISDKRSLRLYNQIVKIIFRIQNLSYKEKNFKKYYNMHIEQFSKENKIDLLFNLEVKLNYKRSIKYVKKDLKVIKVTKENLNKDDY